LQKPNVVGTLTALQLATDSKMLPLCFISTLGMFFEHSVGKETQNPLDSTLTVGYLQSKNVAENLLYQAQDRGLPVTILRPGLIAGDSRTGCTTSSDLLWDFFKMFHDLKRIPAQESLVEICNVDYVANCSVAIFTHASSIDLKIFNISNKQDLKFTALNRYFAEYFSQIKFKEMPVQKFLDSLKISDRTKHPMSLLMTTERIEVSGPIIDSSNTSQLAHLPPCVDMSSLIPRCLEYLSSQGFFDDIEDPVKFATFNDLLSSFGITDFDATLVQNGTDSLKLTSFISAAKTHFNLDIDFSMALELPCRLLASGASGKLIDPPPIPHCFPNDEPLQWYPFWQVFGTILTLFCVAISTLPSAFLFQRITSLEFLISNPTWIDPWITTFNIGPGFILLLIVPLWMVTFSLLVLLLKVFVIGRQQRGSFSLWSLAYFKWWFMERLYQIWNFFIGNNSNNLQASTSSIRLGST
jgi:nucleoside-diphosphate-sugar epimerase